MLAAAIWLVGLVDSLTRPSVAPSLQVQQQELSLLAQPSVPETLQALTHNCISQIFNKLALAAQREGETEHSDSFKALEQEHYDKYQVLLKIGEQKQLESEYQEFIRVLGEDTNQWPLSIRRKFKL